MPADLWRTPFLVGVASSAVLLILHPSVWVIIPLALDGVLAWVALASIWAPSATG